MVKFQIPDIALPAFTKLSLLSAEETEKQRYDRYAPFV